MIKRVVIFHVIFWYNRSKLINPRIVILWENSNFPHCYYSPSSLRFVASVLHPYIVCRDTWRQEALLILIQNTIEFQTSNDLALLWHPSVLSEKWWLHLGRRKEKGKRNEGYLARENGYNHWQTAHVYRKRISIPETLFFITKTVDCLLSSFFKFFFFFGLFICLVCWLL